MESRIAAVLAASLVLAGCAEGVTAPRPASPSAVTEDGLRATLSGAVAVHVDRTVVNVGRARCAPPAGRIVFWMDSHHGPPALFVVDGVRMSGDQVAAAVVRPEDIVSIHVIEGVDAIRRYGREGRNGVVLVGTRRAAVPAP
jgi:hypothetical protein